MLIFMPEEGFEEKVQIFLAPKSFLINEIRKKRKKSKFFTILLSTFCASQTL
jgi:hypothetical protein